MEKTLKKWAVGLAGVVIIIMLVLYGAGFFNHLTSESPILNTIFHMMPILIRINVFWIGLVIFLENENPSRTIAWLIVLILLPAVGFVIYILVGRSYRKKHRAKSKYLYDSERTAKAAEIQLGLIDYIDLPGEDTADIRRLMQLLLKNVKAPLYLNNEVTVLTNGISKFNRLIEAISQAKRHIHLEYFIIKDDQIGNQIRELLIRKAQEGLEVRVIYDDVGSWALSRFFLESLKKAGVEVYPFFKVALPLLSRDLNYRNHRKIVVIDGEIGFVGGLNIGDEYLGQSDKFAFWRDTHLEIRGEAVYGLQTIFLNDWHFVSQEVVEGAKYFPEIGISHPSVVQIAASGPDSEWKSILQAFYKMIASATDKIWITTPYLVPEESLMMGLKTAALSGVDVKIIIPSQPDHFFVYWSSQSNIQSLLEAGVKIYQYKNGFIHSKIMIVDRQFATVGTANLDIRSMEINFEVNAFLYDVDVIIRLEEDFVKDLEESNAYVLERFKKRSIKRKLMEALGRLVSPLQ